MSNLLLGMVMGLFALGIVMGIYVSIQNNRGDPKIKIKGKANLFIILGGLEGLALTVLLFPLFDASVVNIFAVMIDKIGGVSILITLLITFALKSLHDKREKTSDPGKFLLFTWFEYFIAIGVFFVLSMGVLMIIGNSSTSLISGTQTPTP